MLGVCVCVCVESKGGVCITGFRSGCGDHCDWAGKRIHFDARWECRIESHKCSITPCHEPSLKLKKNISFLYIYQSTVGILCGTFSFFFASSQWTR